MPKLILVTKDWSGLGIALLAQRQGSQVIAAYDYTKVDPEDLEHVELIGDGLIEKTPLQQATKKLLLEDNVWFFDNNELPNPADRLRKAGELVIGTSRLSAKMENDRDYAIGVAEQVGLKAPESKKFTDYESAVQFLKSRKDHSYVYKPFEGDATSTYVPQEREDLAKANAELQEYILSLSEGRPKFILQEVVEGVEAAFDLWVRDGKPIVAFADVEAKRKLTGELGENIGCAGGYVTKVSMVSRGVKETALKYLRWDELHDYTGSVDVNVIITPKGPLFLENCFRFAYCAYPAMFHCLALRKVEETIREWITGTGSMESWFKSGFAGSLTLTSDNAKDGQPLLIPKAVEGEVDVYRAFNEESHLRIVEGWPEIACVTSHGSSISSAGQKCLHLAEQVSFPDKGYRVDLTLADLPNLPLSRYEALRTQGWFREVSQSDRYGTY